MCTFCGSTKEEKDAINRKLIFRAQQLELFADRVRLMGIGKLKPHTAESAMLTTQAHNIIRFLVEDFM